MSTTPTDTLLKGRVYHVELHSAGRINMTFNGRYGNILHFTSSNGEPWTCCAGHVREVVAA